MFVIEAVIAEIALAQARVQSGLDPKDLPKLPEQKQTNDSNTDFLAGMIIGEILGNGNHS